MRQSEAINWSVAILLSLLVHSIVLMGSGARMGEEMAIVSQTPIITRLSFNELLDDTVLDEPRPIERQQARPVKKVVAEPVQSKPVETKPTEEKPIIRQTESLEKIEPISQVAVQEHVQGRQVSDSSEKLLQQERQQYLQQLMSHIESFKYYPRAARKRSLEGEVKVSFILLDDGSYKQLSLDGRHSALVKASRVAMELATPLPVPPNDMAIPGQIDFTMSYSLIH
jgi:periplasmic protein TonB